MKLSRTLLVLSVAALATFSVACKKKVAAATPAPVVSAPATPAVVQKSEPAPVAKVAPEPPAAPRSRYPDAATVKRIEELLARIQDAYFDYDKHLIRPDAQATLTEDAKTLADILKQYPDYKLTVEGHCDERGSAEYNMALGDARARAAKDYVVSLGIPADQLQTVSYGKEKPVCTDNNEDCWQKNRRAHIVAMNR